MRGFLGRVAWRCWRRSRARRVTVQLTTITVEGIIWYRTPREIVLLNAVLLNGQGGGDPLDDVVEVPVRDLVMIQRPR